MTQLRSSLLARRRSWVVVVSLVGSGVAAACSSFSSEDTPAPCADCLDAAAEGATGDATPSPDAQPPSDAGDGGAPDGSPLGYCASRPGAVFCEDFDGPDGGDAGKFTPIVIGSPSASLQILAAPSSPSPPARLVASYGNLTSVGFVDVAALRELPAQPGANRLRIGADVRLDTAIPCTLLALYFRSLSSAPAYLEISSSTGTGAPDRLRAVNQTGVPVELFSSAFPPLGAGAWQRLELEVDFGLLEATLRRNGSVIATGKVDSTFASDRVMELDIGVARLDTSTTKPASSVEIDNVLVTVVK